MVVPAPSRQTVLPQGGPGHAWGPCRMFGSPNAAWQLVHCTVNRGKAALPPAYTHAHVGDLGVDVGAEPTGVRVQSTAGAASGKVTAAN